MRKTVSEIPKTSVMGVSLAGLIGKSYDFAVYRVVQGFFPGGIRLKMRFGIEDSQVDALSRFKYHRITEENQMLSGQAGCKARILPVLLVVFGLWVPVAIAAVNADFFEAAGRGDMPAVKRFIADGVDVNAKRGDGTTALYVASYYGHREVVELLLADGANVNVNDKGGATALHAASQEDHREVVEALLAKGADINAKTNNGLTALHIALKNGFSDVAQLLLAKGADVNVKGKEGETALHIAAKNGNGEVVELLLAKGADVNAKTNITGTTALHDASYYGHKEIVELLLAKGADINAKELVEGETALQLASRCGHKEIVELLLAKGADVNTKRNNGLTALHAASQSGDREIVELLLAKGADVNAKGPTNLITPLYDASWEGHRDVVELLLAKGADIDAKIFDGTTALHIASKKGHRDVVELLLAKGADVDAKDNEGETALQLASREGHKDVVDVLARGAKSIRIKEPSSSGTQVQGGHYNTVKPVSSQVSDNVATAERTSTSMPRDSASTPSTGLKSTVQDINSPVEKGSSITFRKLAESVFKGVHQELGTENLVTDSEKVLRRPGTKERTVLPEGTKLNSFEAIRVRGDGRRYIVTFWTADNVETDIVGGGAAILAVFPEGSSEPQDVAEVKSDRFCSIEDSLFPIGPDDAFTITNSHHNSSQGYLNTSLFHVHQGRLQRIAEIFTLRLNTICKDSFEEQLTWRTEPDAGSPYPKVVATVKLTHGISEEDGGSCPKGKAGFRREEFSAIRRWDKAKEIFVLEGKGLDALERFNSKNF